MIKAEEGEYLQRQQLNRKDLEIEIQQGIYRASIKYMTHFGRFLKKHLRSVLFMTSIAL